jgi:hypothetical protein
LLRSNKKGCGGKTHYTDSQNSDTTAPSGRELYCLQFSLHAASLETFGLYDNSTALLRRSLSIQNAVRYAEEAVNTNKINQECNQHL